VTLRVAVMVATTCATVGAILFATGPLASRTSAAAAAPNGTGGAPTTWEGYFYPLKVGWTCHESLDASGITGSETLTIAAVGNVPQGRSVTVTEGSSSTVNGTSVPTNAALHYILSKGGQLISVPSDYQVGGQPYSIKGNTTYPSVRSLLSGGNSVSHLHVDAPLSETDAAELKGVLPAGATSLDMAVSVTQRGNAVASLQTSMGTFHHVLAVHSTVKDIAFTNISKAGSKELAAAIKPLIAKALSATAWYAPGVGVIKNSVDGLVTVVTDCGAATS
jgi:hypothetical protein